MLSLLFGSEARIKILNFFLLSQIPEHSLSQLGSETGLSAVILRRELICLEKSGLIKKQTTVKSLAKSKADPSLYNLEKNFILYPELKALFIKTQILFSQKFVNDLKKICQPKFIALCGLFVNNSESPTDIFIVARVRRSEFLKLLKELEHELGKEINFTLMDEHEFIYRREIMDVFLYNVLEGDNIILIDQIQKK